jgi:tRNA (adenine22-N1)-methyltransferase
MLNTRLQACADLITPGAHICDVGTDHAQLAVYLLEAGIADEVIASDIGEGPLQAAQRTIQAHGLSDKIRTILSDGLLNIPPEGLTHIVIAGMGGETIIHILEECPFPLDHTKLILQPMTKARELRKYLYSRGFSLTDEVCVRDDRYLYAVMQACYTGEAIPSDAVRECLGALDLHLPAARDYAERVYQQLCKARDGRRSAGQPDEPFSSEAEQILNRLEEFR